MDILGWPLISYTQMCFIKFLDYKVTYWIIDISNFKYN